MTEGRMLVVVVTGLSGAGKSTVINALEDLGFFCVDNLPMPVVGSTLQACARGGMRRVALGIDVRVRSFLEEAGHALDAVADCGHDVVVVFLDASDEVLLRRFSSTRRPHPLTASAAEGGPRAILDGVRMERPELVALRGRATLVIDTTLLSVHDLRRRIIDHFGPRTDKHPRMRIRFVSFGFSRGIPIDADMVFDVRFLPNPFFVEALSALSGQTPEVQEYLTREEDCRTFMRQTRELLEFLVPRFEDEGKAYLTIAFGCTGGRHRSVAMAELMAEALRGKGHAIDVVHRDVLAAQSDLHRSRPSEGPPP